jgi:hypothetical protein
LPGIVPGKEEFQTAVFESWDRGHRLTAIGIIVGIFFGAPGWIDLGERHHWFTLPDRIQSGVGADVIGLVGELGSYVSALLLLGCLAFLFRNSRVSANTSRLIIHKAVFRVWGSTEQIRELTKPVADLVKGGSLNFDPAKEFGDPFPNQPKTFDVDFSLNGSRRMLSRANGERIVIPPVTDPDEQTINNSLVPRTTIVNRLEVTKHVTTKDHANCDEIGDLLRVYNDGHGLISNIHFGPVKWEMASPNQRIFNEHPIVLLPALSPLPSKESQETRLFVGGIGTMHFYQRMRSNIPNDAVVTVQVIYESDGNTFSREFTLNSQPDRDHTIIWHGGPVKQVGPLAGAASEAL